MKKGIKNVDELHDKVKQSGRLTSSTDLTPLAKFYIQYQKENQWDVLPNISDLILDNLHALKLWLRSLDGTNDLYTKAKIEYSDLLKFLSNPIQEIKFKSKEKGNQFSIKNEYLISALNLIVKELPVIKKTENKKVNQKKLLSKFLEKGYKNIAKIKGEGVSDYFIVSFINNTPLFSLELDLELIDFGVADGKYTQPVADLWKKILKERKNKIDITSVEAFRKAYSRTKPLSN